MSVQLVIFLIIFFAIAILAVITYCIVRPITLTHRAIEYYNSLTKLLPWYAKPYNNRGLVYFERGEYQRAIQDYNRALALNSRLFQAYNNRGLVYYKLKEYQFAITDLDHVIELAPNDFLGYHSRGLAYSGIKEYQLALADYDRTLVLNSSYATAYYHRGFAYLRLGNIERARVDFLKGREYDPQSVRTAWMIEWIGMCLEKPGVEEAEQLEQTAAIDPQHH